jgi:hypothetical protein
MPRSPNAIDGIIFNPFLPTHPDFIDASTPNEKRRWRSSSPSPPPIPPPIERKHRYSFRLSVQQLEVSSHIRNLFIKPKKLILIVSPIILTIIICVITVHGRHYVKENIMNSSYSNATQLFRFCTLYDNNYYVNLVTLPIALVIIIVIIINQTRSNCCSSDKDKKSGHFSVYTPIPFNPFSKVNRFDTMVLCGIVSHEILQIIEEIFLKATQMQLLTMRGPLFDLIRQIGLVIIIGMRYYPIYTVVEMPDANMLYYGLCAIYMWIDLIFRVLEQSYCVNIGPLIKAWHKFQQFKNEVTSNFATNSLGTTTMAMHQKHRGLKGFYHRIRDDTSTRSTTPTTTIVPHIQVKFLYPILVFTFNHESI